MTFGWMSPHIDKIPEDIRASNIENTIFRYFIDMIKLGIERN